MSELPPIVEASRQATGDLLKLLGVDATNARKAAEANDTAWDNRLRAIDAPWYAANEHDRNYWRGLLGPYVTPETLEELFRSMRI